MQSDRLIQPKLGADVTHPNPRHAAEAVNDRLLRGGWRDQPCNHFTVGSYLHRLPTLYAPEVLGEACLEIANAD